MSGDVVAYAGYDRLLISFYSTNSLLMVCGQFNVFYVEICIEGAKEFAVKLCTIASKNTRRYTIQN